MQKTEIEIENDLQPKAKTKVKSEEIQNKTSFKSYTVWLGLG